MDTVSDECARDLPCDPKLARGAGHFSRNVHMISDLGNHCYATTHFVRRRGSPRVASSHRHFTHSPPEPPNIDCR